MKPDNFQNNKNNQQIMCRSIRDLEEKKLLLANQIWVNKLAFMFSLNMSNFCWKGIDSGYKSSPGKHGIINIKQLLGQPVLLILN